MPAGFHCPRSGQIVAAASAATLAIGLFFVFVWAPHPWGWYGIDQYHQLAVQLANAEPFQTFDVPWGYAYRTFVRWPRAGRAADGSAFPHASA